MTLNISDVHLHVSGTCTVSGVYPTHVSARRCTILYRNSSLLRCKVVRFVVRISQDSARYTWVDARVGEVGHVHTSGTSYIQICWQVKSL